MQLQPGSKVLFIGDSITDAGRVRSGDAPSEGIFDPMGRGYVTFVEAMPAATHPERKIRVVNVVNVGSDENIGNSGDTFRHLASRWDRDLITPKPDCLSVMVGTNFTIFFRRSLPKPSGAD